MKLAPLAATVGAGVIVCAAAPLAHAYDEYVGVAIYDPPGPTVEVVHEAGESPTAAIAHALARCNARYSDCQPVGVSSTCLSVAAGPGINWVFDTGPDPDSAAANARVKASEDGWTDVYPITHCSWGD